MSISSIFLFVTARLFIFLLVVSAVTKRGYSQTSNYITKRGGVCFRIDDNNSILYYKQFANLFNKYHQHFCLAINLGANTITTDYINGLKEIQSSGHEMMDHTPQHGTSYFRTNLSIDYFLNHPGVHGITNNNKVMLEYADVDIKCAERNGYADINKDTVRGSFTSFADKDCYLYFPSLDKLVFIHPTIGWINENTVKVTDFWQNSINLGIHQNIKYYNFDFNNIHLTVDAVRALIEESLRLADYYGLDRPQTWIQPGTYGPHIHREELKEAGSNLGYKSADSYEYVLKVFNEYNPTNDKEFGIGWGNFDEDAWDLNKCKQSIADRIAKHQIAIGSGHFSELLDGLAGTLIRIENIIQWCVDNNIPIRTYSEWADILYNQTPDPNENVFPPLNIDLDANNIPDGYKGGMKGILKKNDGIPAVNNYCYSISNSGAICSITSLGGIEKGRNEFEVWTKGKAGNFIEVVFKAGSQNFIYKFPAENSQWTKFNLEGSVNGNTSLTIPENVSVVDITINCCNYSSGEVKISGMTLKKYGLLPVELASFTVCTDQNAVQLKWQTIMEINNYGFEIERQVSSKEYGVRNEWEKIGFVKGNGNSNSPKDYTYVDLNPCGGSRYIYRLKQIDNNGKFEYSNEAAVNLIVERFVLYQNYPNPFNSSTIIRYGVTNTSMVTIHIYNTIGEEIDVLNEGLKETGFYNVHWQAKDLPTGVYFYSLTAKDPDGVNYSTKTMKTILIR